MKPLLISKYSPVLNELVLESLSEILGADGMETLSASLLVDQRPCDAQTLERTLVDFYGQHSAAGILIRAGRTAFTRLLLKFAAELGYEDQHFRLLAPRRKMGVALQSLAEWLNRQGGGEFEVRIEEDCWQWFHRPFFEEENDTGAGMACPFLLGMLQELSYWVNSGRVHPIREKPYPQGCLLEIEKKPLD